MILAITENDAEREYQQLRDLVGTRIAGLVISPSTHVLDDTRRLLAEFPVVELHRVSGIDAPSVFSDDEQALTDSHPAPGRRSGTPRSRTSAPPGSCPTGPPGCAASGAASRRPASIPAGSRSGWWSRPRRTAGTPTRELLDGTSRFTALVVGSGSLSVGAAEAVRRSGRRLPGDLSLVVYGDPAWFVLADPPLTMVQVPYAALARRAARLLLRALDAREVGTRPPAPGPHLVPAELRVAGSTGSPPGRRP